MSGVDLTRPLAELAADVRSGKLTAVELLRHSLQQIEDHDSYHAVLALNSEAMAQAEAVDAAVAAGKDLGPLAGIPFTAKDNFLTTGSATTAASNILKPFKAPYVATAVERLLKAGAVLVAKVNHDAFGHGSSTENSDFGPSRNPVDPERVPGGSSGGSATAVKLGLCAFSIATDTGGSIRQPASLSGVVGLKPTYGLVSRSGVAAMGSSFDTIGPIANRVDDAALVLDVMAGRDPLDATTIERDPKGYVGNHLDLAGLRIGVIKEYFGEGVAEGVSQNIHEAIAQLKERGAEVTEVSIPALKHALASYYIAISAEISSNLARYDGVRYGHSSPEAKDLHDTYLRSRDEGFGAEAKRRILIGTYVLSSGYYDAYYKKAQQVRTLLIQQFQEALGEHDVLVGPVSPTTAFKLGEKEQDPLAMYVADIATVAINLVGVPAISMPVKPLDGLPVGLQIIGAQRSERHLLGIARAAEEALA